MYDTRESFQATTYIAAAITVLYATIGTMN